MKRFIFILSFLFTIISYCQNVNIQVFAAGFANPLAIENAGDERLFIVEQAGLIKILKPDGTTNATPFLDIDNLVLSGGERGLLGLAFHPDYSSNGYFYVNYTNNSGNTVISRFSVTADPDIADESSGSILLTINQPYSNHNGGSVSFGPDGYLYIGMGDGGSGGDPENYSQNTLSFLGKMLRIDVDNGTPYGIPADNPFVGNSDYLEEIWAIGLRNPWKYSFDKLTGDLWIGDVGQYEIEEIDFAENGVAGLNYGWRCYEGNSEYNTSGCGNISEYTFPVAEYTHTGSGEFKCSITGGYVYRGTSFTNYVGLYFFADYCSNEIGTVDPNNAYQITYNGPFSGSISSFGEDVNGELYVCGLSNGTVYKIYDETIGLGEIEKNKFNITPNPAKGSFTVESDSFLCNISIHNSTGKLIINESIDNVSNYFVNINSLETGVYFIRTETTSYTGFDKLIVH